MEPYTDEQNGFALFRPAGWTVETGAFLSGRRVEVRAPRRGTVATLISLQAPGHRRSSVDVAGEVLRQVQAEDPSLRVVKSRSTTDRRATVIETERTHGGKALVRGRYYVLSSPSESRGFACEAPAAEFERSLPVLLSIVANFSVLNAAAGKTDAAARRTGPPAPGLSSLAPARLPDGSATLQAPKGWAVVGQKGMCLCHDPEAGAGFAFSTGEFLAPSRIPYFDGSTVRGMVHSPYLAPVDAMALLLRQLGNRDVRVVSRATNPAAAREAAARLGRGADAESAVLSFVTGKDVAAKGFFDVLGLRPMPSGQWGIVFFAVWAPESRLDDYRPVLEKAAGSYRVDERWAAAYIEQGLANLRRLMGETRRHVADTARSVRESGMAAFEERMRSGDYIDFKRTATIRGEQEWVSEVEGGALYKSDHWGLSREGERVLEGAPYNYPNFQGRNPRYNETMTPVDVSREVYERVHPPR